MACTGSRRSNRVGTVSVRGALPALRAWRWYWHRCRHRNRYSGWPSPRRSRPPAVGREQTLTGFDRRLLRVNTKRFSRHRQLARVAGPMDHRPWQPAQALCFQWLSALAAPVPDAGLAAYLAWIFVDNSAIHPQAVFGRQRHLPNSAVGLKATRTRPPKIHIEIS